MWRSFVKHYTGSAGAAPDISLCVDCLGAVPGGNMASGNGNVSGGCFCRNRWHCLKLRHWISGFLLPAG